MIKLLVDRMGLVIELRVAANEVSRGAALNEQANILHELERRMRDLHAAEVREERVES